MAWWLGFALLLSPWLVMMLGQAWVQWGLACKAVHDDRSGLRSASDFHSFGIRLGRVDRPICSMVRMCGDQAVQQGVNGCRAGSHGGQGSGLPAAVGLYSAVQRDRVRTRLRRLHG
mmetsp:Transcript_15270/g.34122  ORF Transcript_15270/g.34122 Transcript_15270/m.34122 type:complete len:116 (-) Transcript_15270:151-498(-)